MLVLTGLTASGAAGYWVSEDDYAIRGDVTCSLMLVPRPALLEKATLPKHHPFALYAQSLYRDLFLTAFASDYSGTSQHHHASN